MSYPAQPYPQPYPQYSPGYGPQQYPMHPSAGHQPYYPAPQPQVIYQERPPSRWNDPNTCWLISLLTLCCGCFIGQECCDSNVCCCLIPCALPRFR